MSRGGGKATTTLCWWHGEGKQKLPNWVRAKLCLGRVSREPPCSALGEPCGQQVQGKHPEPSVISLGSRAITPKEFPARW